MAGLYVYIKRVKKRFSAEAKNIPAQCFLPRKTHQRTCSVAYVIHTSGAHKRYTLSMRTMYIVYIVYMYIHKTTSPSIAQLLHSFAAVHYSYTHTYSPVPHYAFCCSSITVNNSLPSFTLNK